ncbi:MAG: ABC transporter substrate-binding protein [Acidimicrobiia bacterium]
MTRRITSLLALVAVALTAVATAPLPATAGEDDFPVTVKGDNGKTEIDSRPERIVSLSPTATEMLFAIGADEQVEAVDDQSDYPADVPTTDLSAFEPNPEAIAGYDPDLVVATDEAVADALDRVDIPVVVFDAPARLKGAYRQIRVLGKATGHPDEAKELVTDMRDEIDALVDEVPDRDSAPTAYWELDDQYFSVSSKTFIGQVLSLAGLANIADEAEDTSEYPQLSSEYIVDSDPDYIFLADTECCSQSPETVADRPGWGDLVAVQNDGVVALNDDVASRWGPRVVELFEIIVEATTT